MAVSGSTLSPVGFFIATPSRVGPPSPLLADNIDPKTKDYRSLFVGADPVDDQVQVAVMTTRGSGGSVLDTGIRFTRNKITSDILDTLAADVRQALRRQIKLRDIQVVRLTHGGPDANGDPTGGTDESNQYVQTNVEYINLRALDPKVRSIPIAATPQLQVI